MRTVDVHTRSGLPAASLRETETPHLWTMEWPHFVTLNQSQAARLLGPYMRQASATTPSISP